MKHTDFLSPETMPVGDGEDSAVALVFDDREKALHLVLGEEGDGSVLPSMVRFGFFGGFDRHSVSLLE